MERGSEEACQAQAARRWQGWTHAQVCWTPGPSFPFCWPHTCPPAPLTSPYCTLLTVEGVGAWLQLQLGGQDNEEGPTPGVSSH